MILKSDVSAARLEPHAAPLPSIDPRPAYASRHPDTPARAVRTPSFFFTYHVADLRGGAAARPQLPVEHDPPAHARPPEDAEQRLVRGLPAPTLNSASVATETSLPSDTGAPPISPCSSFAARAGTCLDPVAQVAGVSRPSRRPCRSLPATRLPRMRKIAESFDPGRLGSVPERSRHLRRDRPSARLSTGV